MTVHVGHDGLSAKVTRVWGAEMEVAHGWSLGRHGRTTVRSSPAHDDALAHGTGGHASRVAHSCGTRLVLVEVEVARVDKGAMDGKIVRCVGVHLADVGIGVAMVHVLLVHVILVESIETRLIEIAKRVGKLVVSDVSSTLDVAGGAKLVVHAHAATHVEVGGVDAADVVVGSTVLRMSVLLIHIESVAHKAVGIEVDFVDFFFDVGLR